MEKKNVFVDLRKFKSANPEKITNMQICNLRTLFTDRSQLKSVYVLYIYLRS
jgi:hypothetical protein